MIPAEKLYPQREALYQETHARPFPRVASSSRVSHLVLLFGATTVEQELRHLGLLCGHFGQAPPQPEARSYYQDLGNFTLRWQRHGEFSTYSFFAAGAESAPFAEPALAQVPAVWVAGLPGQVLGSANFVLSPLGTGFSEAAKFDALGTAIQVGSQVKGHQTQVWSSLQLDASGFVRYLLLDQGMNEAQLGRVLQRMMELETYRILALLALPLARRMSGRLNVMDFTLILVADQIKQISELEAKQNLLAKLSELSLEVAELRSHSFRFGAAEAYFELVEEILQDLNEEKLPSQLTFGEFLHRRLMPARRTCQATMRRIQDLGQRIDHASDLLSTAVNLSLEEQNQELLHAMDRRQHLQHRLQEAVEGLSIAAISYYTIGLLKILLKGGEKLGLPLNSDLASAVAVPLVLLLVWWAVHRIKEKIIRKS